MDETGEHLPLLQKNSAQDSNGWCGRKFRFFCPLTLVLMFFKGGEEMSSVTRKLYIYVWSEAYVNASQRTALNNTSNILNKSDSCGHDQASKKMEHDAQVLASDWELYFSILDAVLLFLSSSVYGTLSDYLGRKPFICLSVLGYALRSSFLVVIIHCRLHIAFMFLPYTIDGVCGSSFAFGLFSYTMTVDVTHGPKDRVLGITIMDALIGIGRCTTQFGSGYYIKATGFFYPMLTATIAIFFSLFLTIFCLKETHPQLTTVKTGHIAKGIRIPGLSTLVRNYTGFYVGPNRDKQIFWLCFSVYFLLEFVIFGRFDPLTLYQLGSPFCWNSEMFGWYGGAMIALCYIIGLVMLKPLQRCLPEYLSACLGLVSSIAFNVLTAIAKTTAGLFIALATGVIMVLPKSILRGMASSKASSDKQGAMFAGLQSSELICKLIAGPASLAIYSYTLNTMKGAVFLVLAGINLIALIVMIYLSVLLLRKDKQNQQPQLHVEDRQLNDLCD